MNAITPHSFNSLPVEMRAAKRWLVWRLASKGEGKKPRKFPYYADGTARSGKLDTPEDWAKLVTFEDAASELARGRFSGLGFALGPDSSGQAWQGVDLDDLPNHQALRDVVKRLPGYVEASPSGKGLHSIGYGRPFDPLGSNASGIEAYSRGRFFTVTGKVLKGASSELADLADFVAGELLPRHVSQSALGARAQVFSAENVVTPKLLGELRDALAHINADAYGNWTRIGLALKTLGEPARELWHDWSSTSEKYDPAEADEKWESFQPERTGYKAIFAEAQRNGWRNPATRAVGGQNVEGISEEDLALAFAQENEAGLRYCDAWSQWLTWDGTRWAPDKTLLATDYARDLCRRAAANVPGERAAAVLGAARTVSAVERLARADRRLAATVEQWDADPWLLNTLGGVVNLRTGKIQPCDPALHMTKVTGAMPKQGGSKPAAWLGFLDRIMGRDTELQGYLQRVLGYALTGDTSAHALFFGYGTGANGKSVLIDTVAGILGDYHTTAPIETFTESNSERHPTDIARLRGARLVTASETEQGRRWAESKIKALTGGDRVAARFMRQDFFEFDPQFKLFIAGNHRPGLRSVDEAMRRRFHLIPFAVTIPPEERDERLKEKLRAEWPEILAWMIEGCLEWQRAGLSPPSAVRAATDAYLEGEDALSTWIDEECERDPQAFEPSSSLYMSWRLWAQQRGEHVGSNRWFAQALEVRGFAPHRKPQARGVLGLRLKKDADFGV